MRVASPVRTVLTSAAHLVLLLSLAEGAYRLASLSHGPTDFDVGPSTGAYVNGFTESEERPPVNFRWSGERGSITLPLASSKGPGTLLLRYGRFVKGCARVHLSVQGERAQTFEACSGRFRNQQLPVVFRDGPIRLSFVIEDPDPGRLGIAIDWIRIEGIREKIPVGVWGPRILVVGLFVLCLLSPLPIRVAWAIGVGFVIVQSVWFAYDPFGMVHVSDKIASSTLVLGALVLGINKALPPIPNRQWILLVFLAGYLFKAAGVFHPSYFYMDVTTHRRYVTAFAEEKGALAERGVAAQKRSGIAYPRQLGDGKYAFPYSPIFYLPSIRLRGRQAIEEGHKHLACAAAAAEVLLVFWLAGLWLGTGRGWVAAVLAAFSPPMYSRLFLAMWPTVTGHLLDLLAIVAATASAAKPRSTKHLAAFGLATLASLLTYVSSLFNLGAFAGFFSLLTRRIAPLVLWAVAATLTVVVLYLPFTTTFLMKIVPEAWSFGLDRAGSQTSPSISAALWRPVYFYGSGTLVLAILGAVQMGRKAKPFVTRTMLAYLLSFILLVAMRASFAALKDLKEILFVGPLISITAAASIETLFEKGRLGKAAAGSILAAFLFYWAIRYREFLEPHITLAGLP